MNINLILKSVVNAQDKKQNIGYDTASFEVNKEKIPLNQLSKSRKMLYKFK
jgi:hypothetical protein